MHAQSRTRKTRTCTHSCRLLSSQTKYQCRYNNVCEEIDWKEGTIAFWAKKKLSSTGHSAQFSAQYKHPTEREGKTFLCPDSLSLLVLSVTKHSLSLLVFSVTKQSALSNLTQCKCGKLRSRDSTPSNSSLKAPQVILVCTQHPRYSHCLVSN